MSDKEWVKTAMADDYMVAELLVHLNHISPPKRMPLEWSVRQRRSKPKIAPAKKMAARASPTTPLSWSGATATSLSGDGFEDSTNRLPPNVSRSKLMQGTERSLTTTTKRAKKKTLCELKEEEVLLLKERKQLKRELATLRSNLEKERVSNESLKRMKLDLQSKPTTEKVTTVASEEAISEESQQNIAASDTVPPILPPITTGNDIVDALPIAYPLNNCFELKKKLPDQETKTLLPDLNFPFEEDSSFEILYGMS